MEFYLVVYVFFFFFFFQAEDGIRDLYVTGVQTCALPIYQLTCVFVDHGLMRKNEGEQVVAAFRDHFKVPLIVADAKERFLTRLAGHTRSEERRVGKECRSRWSQYHEKKKEQTRDSECLKW